MKRREALKRTKALGPGKKTRQRREVIHSAILKYFSKFGWLQDDQQVAPCQSCSGIMYLGTVHPHHKTPRSELRKAGAEDLDQPHRLLMVDFSCHRFIHNGMMGRPLGAVAEARFDKVEGCLANSENGEQIPWSPQELLDLRSFNRG